MARQRDPGPPDTRGGVKKTRGSGMLLHITALPSRFGIGDLGPAAYRFADFLAAAGQRYWQILPLNPTDPAYGNSPYQRHLRFAKNPLLISPELMVDDGLIDAEEVEDTERFPDAYVDFARVVPFKERLFYRAYDRFVTGGRPAGLREVLPGAMPGGWTISPSILPYGRIFGDCRGAGGRTA